MKVFLDDLYLTCGMKFLDVGAGDGFLLEKVAEKFPEGDLCGVEKSWCAYRAAKKRRQKSGGDYTLVCGGFEDMDFGEYDVIYVYMIPYLMDTLEAKCVGECKSGTVVYCNSFGFGGREADRKISVDPGGKAEFIYVYNF